MSKKKYKYVKLEFGSLAYDMAEEAIEQNKVISKYFSECFTSISQKKEDRLEFDFDVFLGSIESFYGKDKRNKIEYLWPLIKKKILNGKPLDKGYITELTKLIEED
jgi:RNase P subunit RPR2